MFATLFAYLFTFGIGETISRHEEEKEWKDADWQKIRYLQSKRAGYDVCNTPKREKMHKKYGYVYDKDMKGQPFDITYEEYVEKNGRW